MMTPMTMPTTISTVRAVELGWRDWSMNLSAWLDGAPSSGMNSQPIR